eukprot:768597-Hanusia_phi.AAC.1
MAEELILNELEAKIRALDEYKSKIGQLRTENGDLLSKLQSKEQDAMDVIKYLRSENDSLQEKLRIYAEDSEKAKEMTEKIVSRCRPRVKDPDPPAVGHESQRGSRLCHCRDGDTIQAQGRRQRERGIRWQMRKLQEELASLKSFKEQRDQYESTIARLREELAQEQTLAGGAQTGHDQCGKEAHRGEEVASLCFSCPILTLGCSRLQKEAHAQLMEIKRNTDEEGKVKNLEKSLSQVAKDFEREKERLVSKSKQDLQDTEVGGRRWARRRRGEGAQQDQEAGAGHHQPEIGGEERGEVRGGESGSRRGGRGLGLRDGEGMEIEGKE